MTQPIESASQPAPESIEKRVVRGRRMRIIRGMSWVALAVILGILGYFDFHLRYTLAFYGVLGVLVIAKVIVFYVTRERTESHSAPKGPNISG